MIKIGDTVINKVQKSEGGVITELPIVKEDDGTLLHLGLNTYKTEFSNNVLQARPVDAYSPFSCKVPNEQTYSTIGSNFIRTRLYADTNITSNTPCELFTRLDFPRSSYQYATGKFCNGIRVQLNYGVYKYSPMKAWAQATISWVVGVSDVPIETIQSSSAGDISNMLPYSTLRGAVAELWINENMQPCYRVIFLGYGEDTGKYYAYSDCGDKVASTNAITFSNLSSAPKYLQANVRNGDSPNNIKREIEIASYKPEDFSSYESNYYLQNMSSVAHSIKGTSSPGTLTSGDFAPRNSVLSGNGSGGSSGTSTGRPTGNVTEEIA